MRFSCHLLGLLASLFVEAALSEYHAPAPVYSPNPVCSCPVCPACPPNGHPPPVDTPYTWPKSPYSSTKYPVYTPTPQTPYTPPVHNTPTVVYDAPWPPHSPKHSPKYSPSDYGHGKGNPTPSDYKETPTPSEYGHWKGNPTPSEYGHGKGTPTPPDYNHGKGNPTPSPYPPTKPPGICPAGCNPHPPLNKCDATTAPTCIYPDPRVPYPRAACACRPGYKAYTDEEYARLHPGELKQWRLPIKGQEHRVWVAEGVKCDVLCVVPWGTGSCREVAEIDASCVRY